MPLSSVRPQSDALQRVRAAPEEVTLCVWLLRQQPLGSIVALAIAAGMGWLVGWSLHRPWLGGLAAGCLFITLWRTWLPITYEIGASGVTQVVLRRRRRVSWSAVRCWEIRGQGVLLVPDAQITPVSPLRGWYLPWLDQRERVLASVEYYLQGRGGL